MEKKEIIYTKRGKIKIDDSNLKCFLGKDKNEKLSENLWKELKDKKIKQMEYDYFLGEEKFLILNPIPNKDVSIITNKGKKYKTTLYFLDDIKTIIDGFKMENPCYFDKGVYKTFKEDDDYKIFLFEKQLNEIKDVYIKKENDFSNLEKKYEKFNNEFQVRDSIILEEINRNIHLYSKMDNIEKEEYFITSSRSSLNYKLNKFCKNTKREVITDVIYGIFGNYASGKSFFLMYYNYQTDFPSIYLNLKALKNSSQTSGFSDLLNNELMSLFIKLKKTYNDFQIFIFKLLPYENKDLKTLITLIISELKNENCIAILDQYQKEIFGNNANSFIVKLKEILFKKDSKIKIIISSSMNDSSIRDAYLNIILDNYNLKEEGEKIENKTNDYIPYNFVEKLVEDEKIKQIYKIINQENKENSKKFSDALNKFNYLPLYFNLCKKYIENLDIFIDTTKKRIEEKIKKFYENMYPLKQMDEIRKMIDNVITIKDLKFYSKYIPYKYFYIEKSYDNQVMILRTHFPLINEVWNNIIMKETIELFDGEISYDGHVIGSFLELNLITNIKEKKIPLDIDSFIKVDTIKDFGKIIEQDTDCFKNKNIFITQKNQNGPSFDLAYIKGKTVDSKKIAYIQVKKSYSSNRVDLETMKQIFEETKQNISNLLGFIPNKPNLVYISLINDVIKKAFLLHNKYKISREKKISELDKTVNSIFYATNQIDNFCTQYGIQLYYYEPKTQHFYKKDKNIFENTELDLFRENNNKINLAWNISHLLSDYEENSKKCININIEYKNYLNIKNKKKKFSYFIDNFDFEIIFSFAKDFFRNAKIVSFINLEKTHLDCKYFNMTTKNAIICLKKLIEENYSVVSFVYNNKFFKFINRSFKLVFTNNNQLDRDNDFIVVISFEEILAPLKSLLN